LVVGSNATLEGESSTTKKSVFPFERWL